VRIAEVASIAQTQGPGRAPRRRSATSRRRGASTQAVPAPTNSTVNNNGNARGSTQAPTSAQASTIHARRRQRRRRLLATFGKQPARQRTAHALSPCHHTR